MKQPCACSLGIVLLATAAHHATAQTQVWLHQLGSSGDEEARAIAPLDGRLFSGGRTTGNFGGPNAGGQDAWLAFLDDDRTYRWIRQFGTGADDEVTCAALDGSTGVHVGGSTSGSLGGQHAGSTDAFIARYDEQGTQLWIRQLGSSGADSALAMAPNWPDVYVAGAAGGSFGGTHAGGTDGWLARYSATGSQLWITQLGSAADDAFHCLARGNGSVFVGGTTSGNLGGAHAGGRDALLALYNQGGALAWVRQLGTSGDDEILDAALDTAGGVFVGGRTDGSLGGPNAGGVDCWLARYDSAGNQLWIRQFGTSGDDQLEAIVLRSWAAHVWIGGTTSGSLGGASQGGDDVFEAHFDGSGNRLRLEQFGTAASDRLLDASVSWYGALYVSGSTGGSLGGPFAGGGSDAWVARYYLDLTSTYCTAGTSAQGCVAQIRGVGIPSASSSTPFEIVVQRVETGRIGTALIGIDSGVPMPWGSGSSLLCVKAPTLRMQPQLSLGLGGPCSGVLVLDWNAFCAAHPSPVGGPYSLGQPLHAQGWFRDPPAPKSTSLSNALRFTLQP